MTDWTQALAALDPARRMVMERLREHLPESDLDCYPVSLFLEAVDHALMLRQEAPWCAELDEEIFFHYVLFPRINDEDLSLYRALFFASLWSRIAGMDGKERIMEVNRWCHEMASYQCQDDRTASPLTVFRCGSGRCGEESAFLVAALRSVGVAARQVYAPRWSHCDDNHAWVEAMADGQWYFLGACEPEPILNRGWFNTASSRAILIHSRTFGPGHAPLHGAPVGSEGNVYYYNQTPRYAKTRPYRFSAVVDGMPAAGAVFSLQVLNEASYHTIATLTADENGETFAELGDGDLHVTAHLGALFAEGDCADGAIVLALGTAPLSGDWVDFDFHAPKDTPVNPALLTGAEKLRRAAVRAEGAALREAHMAEYYDEADAKMLPHCADLLREARGNFDSILHFLTRDKNPLREPLVRSLSLKDLRDAPDLVLEDHLLSAAPRTQDTPEDIYVRYVLCPRIAWEALTPWRSALAGEWSQDAERYRADPAALWSTLTARLHPAGDRSYPNLYWFPKRALAAGRCDTQSLRVLFVALLRTMGVAARLRAADGMPEFWRDGGFHPALPAEEGTLHLTQLGEATPAYRQNWTLSRWNGAGWTLLTLSDPGWQDGSCQLSLPVGRYRLITSVRLPNGNQFAARREFDLTAGNTAELPLRLREFALADLLGCQELPVIPAQTLEGDTIADAARQDSRPRLLFWMEEGNEPTEHVLNELMAGQGPLSALPVGITFLLRGRESLRQSTLSKTLSSWPEIQVLLDDWAFDLDTVARHLTCDPDRPPLAVVVNGSGQAVYGVSGYHVGSVELLTRIAARLCSKP